MSLLENKKSQAVLIDLMVLLLLISIVSVMVISYSGAKSFESAKSRYESVKVQKLLIAVLNYEKDNLTIAERIGLRTCGKISKEDVEENIKEAMQQLNKGYHYIFIYDNHVVFDKYKCVKIKDIVLANAELYVPCRDKPVQISLGIWPKSKQVEPC